MYTCLCVSGLTGQVDGLAEFQQGDVIVVGVGVVEFMQRDLLNEVWWWQQVLGHHPQIHLPVASQL